MRESPLWVESVRRTALTPNVKGNRRAATDTRKKKPLAGASG
jgi:hypothetical protein